MPLFHTNALTAVYGIFWMPPGESSHPGGSEYVWQREWRVFQAELRAAEVYPISKKLQLK